MLRYPAVEHRTTAPGGSSPGTVPARTPAVPAPQRIGWIDRAKGIGIVLVYLGHLGVFSVPPEHRTELVLLVKTVFAFHMPLFFFLAGLVFHGKLARRARVLLGSWLLSGVAAWGLGIGLASWTSRDAAAALLALIRDALLGKNLFIAVNWFLVALFVTEALYAGLRRVPGIRSPGRIVVVSIPLSVATVVLSSLPAGTAGWLLRLGGIWQLQIVAAVFVVFAVGAWLRPLLSNLTRGLESLPSWLRWISVGLLTTLVTIATIANHGATDLFRRQFGTPVPFLLGAFAGIELTILLATARLPRLLRTALEELGRHSLVLFILNGFWMAFTLNPLIALLSPHPHGVPAVVLFLLLIALAQIGLGWAMVTAIRMVLRALRNTGTSAGRPDASGPSG